VPIVLKSASLNLLEISGPVQACNGITLPLPLLEGSDRSAGRLKRLSQTEMCFYFRSKLRSEVLMTAQTKMKN